LRSETGGEVEAEEELGAEDTSGCMLGGSAMSTRVEVMCGGQEVEIKMKEVREILKSSLSLSQFTETTHYSVQSIG